MTEQIEKPADDDIDAILKQFEEDEPDPKPAAAAAKPGDKPAADDLDTRLANHPSIKRAEQAARALEQDRLNQQIGADIRTMKGKSDVLKDLPDETLRDLLDGEARRDKRILNAFQQKSQNPEAWDKILGSLATKYEGLIAPKRTDDTATGDREAMRLAATRRAGGTGKPAKDEEYEKVPTMTDAEFDAYKRKRLGQARQGITV